MQKSNTLKEYGFLYVNKCICMNKIGIEGSLINWTWHQDSFACIKIRTVYLCIIFVYHIIWHMLPYSCWLFIFANRPTRFCFREQRCCALLTGMSEKKASLVQPRANSRWQRIQTQTGIGQFGTGFVVKVGSHMDS